MSIRQLREDCIDTLKKIPDNVSEREIGYTIAIIHLIKIIDEKYSKLLIHEILDEEIEKAAFDYVENSEEDKWTATLTFIAGVKWYKEHLKP
jgi:hypothetical protein